MLDFTRTLLRTRRSLACAATASFQFTSLTSHKMQAYHDGPPERSDPMLRFTFIMVEPLVVIKSPPPLSRQIFTRRSAEN
jgi:hypothetical protein